MIDSLLCDNMQTRSWRHQSDSHISSSSHWTWSHAEFNDPLEENSSSASSLHTMQHETDDSVSTIQGLNNELKQTEKKRDLLLKKCCLASVQREIQVLWSQDADELLVNDSSDLKADYISSISEHTQFSLYQAVCRELPQHNDVEEKYLLRVFEHLYWEDNTEASQLCTQHRDSISSDV